MKITKERIQNLFDTDTGYFFWTEVIGDIFLNDKGQTCVNLKCSCGKIKSVRANGITRKSNPKPKSCGCSVKNNGKPLIHGGAGTRLNNIWNGMKQRVSNPNFAQYHDYGGRGIDMDENWKIDFEVFRNWAVANGYQEDLTIERINNDSGYYPDNCTWIPRSEQSKNRRNNRMITVGMVTLSLSQWCRELSITPGMVYFRVKKNNMSWEDAIMVPRKRVCKKSGTSLES